MTKVESAPGAAPPPDPAESRRAAVAEQVNRLEQSLESRVGQMVLRLDRRTQADRNRLLAVKRFDLQAQIVRTKLESLEREFHQRGGWGQLDDGVIGRAQRIYQAYLDQYVCPELCQELERNGLMVGSAELPDRYHELPVSYRTFLLYGVAELESSPSHRHAADSEPPCQRRSLLAGQNLLSLAVDHDGLEDDSLITIPAHSPDQLRALQAEDDLSQSGLLGVWHDGIPAEDEFAAYIPPERPTAADRHMIGMMLRTAADCMVFEWQKANQLTRFERSQQQLDALSDEL